MTQLNVRTILTNLKQHYRVWLIPAVLCFAAATTFAFLRKDTWKASQAILVRDEAGGSIDRLGRFASADAMKTAQETILEIARNQAVIAAALKEVGPAPDTNKQSDAAARGSWPTVSDIESLQDAIAVSAPKGAEFGKTEVIYLSVKAHERDRAIALTSAVCDQLEARLQELRDKKARSIIDELARTVQLAQTDLDTATKKLETMEQEVGSDLGELRMLNDLGSGDSNLRTALNQIKIELRQAKTVHEASQQLLDTLMAAQAAPEHLVATSNRLTESQPALKRLKEGLVDAQLRTAQLLGKMSADHPEVQAAIAAENEVREHLHGELAIAIRGLTEELKVSGTLVASLEKQQADITSRLSRLAGLRARYGNLVAEVRQRSEILAKAEKELADARASQTAARSTSLLTRLDQPVTGGSPQGPSRAMISLAGLVGGLVTGFGCVLLVAPITQLRGRRISDYFRGRRATDQVAGQRSTDQPIDQRATDRASGQRTTDLVRGQRATDAVVAQRASDFAGRRGADAATQRHAAEPSDGRRATDGAAPAVSNNQAEELGTTPRRVTAAPAAPAKPAATREPIPVVLRVPKAAQS